MNPILRRDFKTETWEHIRAHIEARLAELQVQNENLNLTDSTTASTRGRIAELRRLLALEKAPAETPAPGASLVPGYQELSEEGTTD